jgi:hypothetical protein
MHWSSMWLMPESRAQRDIWVLKQTLTQSRSVGLSISDAVDASRRIALLAVAVGIGMLLGDAGSRSENKGGRHHPD